MPGFCVYMFGSSPFQFLLLKWSEACLVILYKYYVSDVVAGDTQDLSSLRLQSCFHQE